MWHGYFYILVLEVPHVMIVSLFVCMIYVVWLVLDGNLCRGGGGLCCYLHILLYLDLMLLNPLLLIAGRLGT